MNSIFLRLWQATDKPAALADAVSALNSGTGTLNAFQQDPREFSVVPGSPLAYWVVPGARRAYRTYEAFENEERTAAFGASSKGDLRFLRAWWESPARGWAPYSRFPYAKGGRFSRYYADVFMDISWANHGRELKEYICEYRGTRGWGYNWSASLNGHDHYHRCGLTWPRRTNGLSVRALPSGTIFGDKGPAAFVRNDDVDSLSTLCAMMNSLMFDYLMRAQLARNELAQSFEVGLVQLVPIAPMRADCDTQMRVLFRSAWSLKRSLDTITETSHAFHLPALLCASVPLCETLSDRAAAWSTHVATLEAELAAIQAEIDDIAFRLYGIDGEDRARIEAEGKPSPVSPPASHPLPAGEGEEETAEDAEDAEVEDDDDSSEADTATLHTELLSWAIGVAFGRFDLRLATGERPAPPDPGPFDPLPARSPGMCPDDSQAVPFLVDDPGHPLDLSARISDIFTRLSISEEEAVRLAGSPDLSTFLRRSFFPFHLKRYSKSRRKAPLWWPLSTASGAYTVWLAWPALTRDTLFRVADEIKHQKLPFESRKLVSLKQDHGPNPSTRQRAEIAAQEDLTSELFALLEEIERVAPLWNPVHDDGVILHHALLWRMVRDAGWQKECRAAWDRLAKGELDWAHIAMHLWPERVVPTCRTDRSLAIAHGLEDTFWVEVGGKWRARNQTDAALDAAIAARTSPAIKAALRALQDAPAPGRAGRARKGA